jgi:beta-D-xylosidase 4
VTFCFMHVASVSDAYSLEDSDNATRHNFNAIVSNYALTDSFFPAFKRSVVQGGALGVMCSYVGCT